MIIETIFPGEMLGMRALSSLCPSGFDLRWNFKWRVRPANALTYSGDFFLAIRAAMRGACAGCPSSTMTLKQGIENMLKAYVPEVTAVEAAL